MSFSGRMKQMSLETRKSKMREDDRLKKEIRRQFAAAGVRRHLNAKPLFKVEEFLPERIERLLALLEAAERENP